jgi:3',5'-cyclic AMP phosphodiesterase CpdA
VSENVKRPDELSTQDAARGTQVQEQRILHVSDLHFGRPFVPEQIEAIEALIQDERFDVVAISGDISQRSRAGEFQRGRVFIRDAERVSKTIIVPGNHDVMWWFAPLHVGNRERLYENYKKYISEDLEPVLRVPGVTFVGLNTAHGVTWRTLTANPHDISIIGDLHKSQLEWAKEQFAQAPNGDAKVVIMHHNPVKGELSQRHGLKRSRALRARPPGSDSLHRAHEEGDDHLDGRNGL